MIGEAMYTTIKTLHKQGLNKGQIAKATGHDWKTISKIIENIKAGKNKITRKKHPKLLDNYEEKIIKYIKDGLSALRIQEELAKQGCGAKYSTVKNFVAKVKRKGEIFVRIHTDAGEEGQVDFGYAGYTLDNAGKRRKTWIFNMKLSYSRYDYYEKVYDQKVVTFIRCHQRAFEFFKGVPKTVRIDNLKAAVLEANFYEPRFQRVYKQFSEHYQFEIIPCRIYRPNDKGKVESGIKYVKNNFFAGRKFKNEDDLNQQLKEWVKQKCNVRIHGTTKKIPQEVFLAQEKEKLISLPESRFKIAEVGLRKVYHDCHIFVESNYYSVPFDFVGCNVDIELSQNVLKIFYEHSLIAVHERLKGKGEFRTNPSHYPKYKVMTEKEYQSKYQKKMIDLGNYAQQIFPIIVKEQPHHWARTVQGILSLSKQYSKEVVDLACKRAISFNVYKYRVIKNICSNASYKLPIESETEVAYYEFPKN